jgi:hypothetical protein
MLEQIEIVRCSKNRSNNVSLSGRKVTLNCRRVTVNYRRRGWTAASNMQANAGDKYRSMHDYNLELEATSTSVRTPKPLPPASSQGLLDSRNEGPAMSRWTHGLPSTNSSRNSAA